MTVQKHRKLRDVLLATIVCGFACCPAARAQVSAPTVLELDIDNVVEYQIDNLDVARFGTNPGITPSTGPLGFGAIVVGDIVAVNGEAAKGTFVGRPFAVGLTSDPIPGKGIADIDAASSGLRTFEILKPDGTAIGTLVVAGLNGAPNPPGSAFGTQNFAIVGGTGAFLGARGQQGGRQVAGFSVPIRAASIREDPANRRRNGGGRVRWLLAVIPMSRPEIVIGAGGAPTIAHLSDSSLVTPSHPAAPGETLYLFATGLGPTAPGVDVGQPFPSTPRAVVNSPVKVTVNGAPADVLVAVGYPGRVDTYQVQFRVPAGTATGDATIQVTAAWIPGPAVTIPVR